MTRTFLLFFACMLQAALLIAAPALATGKRVALVIGNATYESVGKLANPIADAKAVSEAFTTAGFEDVRLVDNLSAESMRRELKDFSARAAEAEIAVVYYAGHGVEVADQNYLVPVDAKLLRSTDIDFEAIPLAAVRSAVTGASKLRLVVLDACRNNPFKLAGNNGTRAATRGLANIEPNAGEVVAYAAKEGTLAQDGEANANSPYATALVRSLKEPGLEIRLLFGKVRDDVLAATANEQEPYTYASLGGEALYLNDAPPLQKRASFRDCEDCPEMVVVPAGSFRMGSPESELHHEKDEAQHDVVIEKPFAVGKFEITRAEYDAFVKTTDHDTGSTCTLWDGTRYVAKAGHNVANPGIEQSADHPALCLSWHDANAYTAWLSKRTGLNYRLLTEAEWEYAARAGHKTPYVSGDILDAATVNFANTATRPVGSFAANAFGLHDTQGNAWEWTQDCYSKTYGTPVPAEECDRTYRGGGWANQAKDLRFATRGTNAPDKRVNIFGLRVARDVP